MPDSAEVPATGPEGGLVGAWEPTGSQTPVVPVSLLVGTARLVIERHLPLMWVSGEISNFTRAASGHCYFALKDESAQVRCVMFRHKVQLQDLALRNGLQVELRASATIYEARGEFQLNVENVRQAGVGRLYEAFTRLKAKLEAQGWFDAARKRALPALPRRVGVVTSPTGAAVRDVVSALARRFPSIPVVVYPTPVQGSGAAAQIAAAIATANVRAECEVLIVCRGGGSIEDLWAFNEEAVARAVLDSAIPVVSGVGHETDFTICDFVADARAPTPTAAAVLAVPDRQALAERVRGLAGRWRAAIERRLERAMQRVDDAGRRLKHPAERLRERQFAVASLAGRLHAIAARRLERDGAKVDRSRERLARLLAAVPAALATHATRGQRLAQAVRGALAQAELRVQRAARGLALLDPKAVLERGYAMVTDASGRVIVAGTDLRIGQSVRIEFASDRADATITATERDTGDGLDGRRR